jgi:YqaJ-like viral recombinase domain
MKTQLFDNKEAWLDARLGRVTGTRLKDLVSKRGGRKIGFYEIIAERIAIPPSGENVMDRGLRLEDEAIKRFAFETGKVVDTSLVLWSRDDDNDIAVSPDGFIGDTEAVECKCLSSARHIEAYVMKQIPDEYEWQVLQYFIVNEALQTLHFVFYDPRMPRDFFWIDVTRAEIADKVAEHLELERIALAEIAEIERQLTF